jgi:hypothetical protein
MLEPLAHVKEYGNESKEDEYPADEPVAQLRILFAGEQRAEDDDQQKDVDQIG